MDRQTKDFLLFLLCAAVLHQQAQGPIDQSDDKWQRRAERPWVQVQQCDDAVCYGAAAHLHLPQLLHPPKVKILTTKHSKQVLLCFIASIFNFSWLKWKWIHSNQKLQLIHHFLHCTWWHFNSVVAGTSIVGEVANDWRVCASSP